MFLRHVFLRFNYGVEIGARLAYLGHYRATGDYNVLMIANEEERHGAKVAEILSFYNRQPTAIFNVPFTVIGHSIYWLCQVSPKSMLDSVAKMMEMFAIFNYTQLSKLYPDWKTTFLLMAEAEDKHKTYFTKGSIVGNSSL